MYLNVEKVIYGYGFICAALLLYNLCYIVTARIRKRVRRSEKQDWTMEIEKQIKCLEKNASIEAAHIDKMKKNLKNPGRLIAYCNALETLEKTYLTIIREYVGACYESIQYLALQYKQKDSMYRAYFAYMIAKYQPESPYGFTPLMEILITFLDNSTVYCRENVLNAFYSLGNCQAIENILQIFNDSQWFHHQKLLSDGLLTFRGDKEKLAAGLWGHLKDWDRNLMVSVVQFIAGFTDAYQEKFLPVLVDETINIELRLAILRYYRRYAYPPVRPILLSYMKEEEVKNENLTIVTAAVLSKYPGHETVEALKKALSNRNWYVRYNAAASLVELGVPVKELESVLRGDDRYAREILVYMMDDKLKAGEGHD